MLQNVTLDAKSGDAIARLFEIVTTPGGKPGALRHPKDWQLDAKFGYFCCQYQLVAAGCCGRALASSDDTSVRSATCHG
jgi:hypothetical protein